MGKGRESREKTNKGTALGHQKDQITTGKDEEVKGEGVQKMANWVYR